MKEEALRIVDERMPRILMVDFQAELFVMIPISGYGT